MFKRFIHITTIIMLMLAISVSFAWMVDVTAPNGHFPVLRFDEENQLFIASNDVDIDLSVEENDEYHSIQNSKLQANDIYSSDNLGPGSTKKFKLTIKNNTDVDLNMSIVLSDILVSNDYFYETIYVGLFSTKGFYSPFEPPEINEYALGDTNKLVVKDGEVSYNLINYFKIPGNYSEVEIRFYVRIDVKADNRLVNQNFKIGTINGIII